MDKVSDFLKELGQRFSNPLIFSFIISWTFYNWKVPVALFFFTEAQLKAEGFSSYVDFISKTVTSRNSLWYPFGLAVAYTIFFPFIREAVKNFNIWVDVISSKLSKRINSSSSIPMEKYYEMLDSVGQKEAKLEQLISSESKLEAENISLKNIMEAQEKQIQANVIEVNSLKDANTKLVAATSELNKLLYDLSEQSDQSFIEGSWTGVTSSDNYPVFEVYISDGVVTFNISSAFTQAKIILYSLNRKMKVLYFRIMFTKFTKDTPVLLNQNWLFSFSDTSHKQNTLLSVVDSLGKYNLVRTNMSLSMKNYLVTVLNAKIEDFDRDSQ